MFIFQIITGGPTSGSPLPQPLPRQQAGSSLPIPSVLPGSSLPQPNGSNLSTPNPQDDFAGAGANAMAQQFNTMQRGALRRNTPIAAAMNDPNINATTFNSDGSYSRPNDSGHYWYQAGGSVFYAGGIVTHPDGRIENIPPRTYRTGSWSSTPENSTMLPGTVAIARLDLIPVGDGSFRRGSEPGKYYIQEDGSIFYDGNGNQAQAQTYVNGNWDTSRNTMMPGTLDFAKLVQFRARRNQNGTWEANIDGTTCSLAVLRDGRVIRFRTGTNDLRVFEFRNNQWVQLSNRIGNFHSDPQVCNAIISATRTEDRYVQSAPAHISNLSHMRYSNGTWAYSGSQFPDLAGNPMVEVNLQGIGNCFIMRTLDDRIIIFQNNQVHSVRDRTDDCFNIRTVAEQGPNWARYNVQLRPEVREAFERIREARANIGWLPTRPPRNFLRDGRGYNNTNDVGYDYSNIAVRRYSNRDRWLYHSNENLSIWSYSGSEQGYNGHPVYYDTVTGNSYILSRDGNTLYMINQNGNWTTVGERRGNEGRVDSCHLSDIWHHLFQWRQRMNIEAGLPRPPENFFQGR